MPLLLEQGCYRGGVNAAAHGHGNQAALNRVARGQSVELGCAAHALSILRENQCLVRGKSLASCGAPCALPREVEMRPPVTTALPSPCDRLVRVREVVRRRPAQVPTRSRSRQASCGGPG